MKRPSDYELGSKIASEINAFLIQVDPNDWAPGLCVVVRRDFGVVISVRKDNCLVAVPLNSLAGYIPPNVLAHLQARLVGINVVTGLVMEKLKAAEGAQNYAQPSPPSDSANAGWRAAYWKILMMIGGIAIAVIVSKEAEKIWREPSLEETIAKTVGLIGARLPMEVQSGGVAVEVSHRGTTLISKIKLPGDRPVLPRNTPMDDVLARARDTGFGPPPPELVRRVTNDACATQRKLLKAGGTLEFNYVDRRELPVGMVMVTDKNCE
jgi:hypothetical protein